MAEFTTAIADSWTWIRQASFSIGDYHFDLWRALVLIFLVLVITLAGQLTERAIRRLGSRWAEGEAVYPAAYALGRLGKYIVFVIGASIGLDTMGMNLSKLAIVGGAIGVGVGFGLQNIVNNFVSGIILLVERSLKVGDFVDLQSGVRGRVVEIAMHATRVLTNDSVDVLVPNSEFVNGRVINWTFDDYSRRIHIPFGVAYGTDKEKVKTAALAAARHVPGVIFDNPLRPPNVWLVQFADSSLNLSWWCGSRAIWSRCRTPHRPGCCGPSTMNCALQVSRFPSRNAICMCGPAN
ncbi:MAG: mechanosensitive ion channel [Gammaproteobacteria bacterium]